MLVTKVNRQVLAEPKLHQYLKGNVMNKLLVALIAGFFAVSVNTAFAADTATPNAAVDKPATHVVKKAHTKAHKKTHVKAHAKQDTK